MLYSRRIVLSVSTCFRCGRHLHNKEYKTLRALTSIANLTSDATRSGQSNTNHDQLTVSKSTSQSPATRPRRNTTILRMDPSEYEGSGVLKKKLPLLERQGEAKTVYQKLIVEDDKPDARTNFLAFWQQDIDLRPEAFKRIWSSIETEADIKTQL